MCWLLGSVAVPVHSAHLALSSAQVSCANPVFGFLPSARISLHSVALACCPRSLSSLSQSCYFALASSLALALPLSLAHARLGNSGELFTDCMRSRLIFGFGDYLEETGGRVSIERTRKCSTKTSTKRRSVVAVGGDGVVRVVQGVHFPHKLAFFPHYSPSSALHVPPCLSDGNEPM